MNLFKTISARSLVAGVVLAAAAAFGTAGGAATVKNLGGSCTFGGAGAGISTSTACAQASPLGSGGNTKLAQMNAQDIFTTETWTFGDKINLPDMVGKYLKISFSSTKLTGTWSLLDGLSFSAGELYAIALKGATTSFVYLLDTSFTSGTWSMIDLKNRGGKTPSLSNITLFGTAAPIPLPATGLLLVGAVAGLALMRRRKLAA